jgi:hypothetical protein
MRQVFSSPRLENVERVATLLGEAGIETRITNGRSYRGALRGNFSYRNQARTGPEPAVWVVKSEDQPPARSILRAAGLLDSTRSDTGYALPMFRTEMPGPEGDPGRKRAFRLKIGLLVVIAVVIVLTFVSLRGPPVMPPQHAALPAGDSPTPDSLVVAVLSGELPTRAGQTVCLEVDGGDPSTALLASLSTTPGKVLPASQCVARTQVQTLSVGAYRRHASGAGTIVLDRLRGQSLVVSHTYDVRPEGSGWRVIEPYQ